MKTVLVTGFEPFAGYMYNPSREVVRNLALSGAHTLILPVGPRARGMLRRRLKALQPDLVLLLGLRIKTNTLDLEQVALNVMQEARQEPDRPIVPHGPLALRTALPHEVVSALNAHDIPTRASYSCGTYYCNQAFYTALHFFWRQGRPLNALFVHLPMHTQGVRSLAAEQRSIPGLPLERMRQGIRLLANTLVRHLESGQSTAPLPGIVLRHTRDLPEDQLLALYRDAGWTAYTRAPERLFQAIRRSLQVVSAWREGQLVGLVRTVGDSRTVLYIQDLLVAKSFQRRGIGGQLVRTVLQEQSAVRHVVLLTDKNEKIDRFYRSLGFVPCREDPLVAYVHKRVTEAP